MSFLPRHVSVYVILLVFSLSAAAKGQFESADFALTEQKALEAAATCGEKATLVVLDIDNTLLTAKQALGGDAWFNWQAGLLGSGSSMAAAADIGGLLKLQGMLFALSSMRPVDGQNPMVIKRLQERGFPVIALTSRGSDFHDVTLRELRANGMDFSGSAIGPKGGYSGTYLPYDLANPAQDGLSANDVSQFKLGPASPVMFESGVFLGGGQNKGPMLKTLLNKTGFQACGIVFTDDTPANTQRVWTAFSTSSVDISVIRYSQIDPEVNAFIASDKSEVVAQLTSLRALVGQIFK